MSNNLNVYSQPRTLSASSRLLAIYVGLAILLGIAVPKILAQTFSDGALDNCYDPQINGRIYSTALQTDGKLIIVGDFNQVNGVARMGIARLNIDGTLDTSFDPGTGAGEIQKVLIQPSGQIVIAGEFTSYNGTPRGNIARLNQDGTLSTFGANIGTNFRIADMAELSSGSIVIVGTFGTYDGANNACVAKLSSSGALDTAYDYNGGCPNGITTVGADGNKAIIWGNGVFARLGEIDGHFDSTFTPPASLSGSMIDIRKQQDGKILIAGSMYLAPNPQYLVRLNNDGTLDSSFSSGLTVFDPFGGYIARAVVPQSDGKILVGGSFDGGVPRKLARLNIDGTLDSTFDQGTGIASGPFVSVNDIAIQSDGKIVAAGIINQYNGINRLVIARLQNATTVSGRVVSPSGTSLRNVVVKMTDPQGVVRSATTSSFGFYTFSNVTTCVTFVFSATSNRYRFTPQQVQITGNTTLPNFVGLE